MNKELITLTTIVVIGLTVFLSAYMVDETEQIVITQFGKVVGEPKKEPGLHFRVPFIQIVNRFPKNLQHWDGDRGQIPTMDKTYIWVETFARWRIINPVKFFQTVNNVATAQIRLNDIIDPAVRNFITSYPLLETVRQTNRKMDTFEIGIDEDASKKERQMNEISIGREKMTEMIQEHASPKLTSFGIEVVDVKIKRVNYVEEVRSSVYTRMIAERKQIAEKFRSEGNGEAEKILGEKERELKRIISEAYRTSKELKGRASGEVIKIYAEAFSKDPEFYSFLETLEIYKSIFDSTTTTIFSTDADFFKLLKRFSQ